MNTYIYAYRRSKRSKLLLHGTMEATSIQEVLDTLDAVTAEDGGEIIMVTRVEAP